MNPGLDPEPTGRTIDGTPWEEPRGPHLPDAITRLPNGVWPFVLLAVVEALLAAQFLLRNLPLPVDSVLLYVLNAVPSVATALLGAAYIAARRKGASTDPIVLGAVSLIALEPLLRAVDQSVLDLVAIVAPLSDDVFQDMWRGSAYAAVATAVGLVGFVLLWIGLHNARHHPDAPGQRRITVMAFGIALTAVGLGAWSVALQWSAFDASTLGIGLAGWSLNALTIVASAGVAAVLLAGARAGEKPLVAWRLAAAGFVTLLLASVLEWATVAAGVGLLLSTETISTLSWVLVIVGAIAGLLWLAAFALGLPSDDPLPESAIATGASRT